MEKFYVRQGVPIDKARELVIEIFNLDVNRDGKLNIQEFAANYLQFIRKLRERQIIQEEKILETYEHINILKQKLGVDRPTSPIAQYLEERNIKYKPLEDNIEFVQQCMINVVEVRNLPRTF